MVDREGGIGVIVRTNKQTNFVHTYKFRYVMQVTSVT